VRIHANDIYRLTRAVEILRGTGRPLSDFAAPTKARPRWDFLVLGLDRPRDELYERIDARVDAMLASGLAEEVARLAAAGYGPGDPGMKAIGYREFFDPAAVGGSLRDRIALDTRRYAKRQMTYFRALPGIRWISPSVEALEAELRAFLLDAGTL
jgi:tRNA dimethylallyltransferase